MIRKLKKNFILTAMTGITLMLVLLLGTINIINICTIYDEIGETLDILSESVDKSLSEFEGGNDDEDFSFGDFMENPKSERDMILSSTFFVVEFDMDGNPIYTNVKQAASLTDEDAIALAEKVVTHHKMSGGHGKYQYHISLSDHTQTVVFLDISEEIVSYIRVLLLSCATGLIGWGIMLAMVVLLSNKAIAPVAESIEKQKQFITDAGHELKTPITVIRSNIEALELFTEKTEWSDNVKNQSQHLAELVQNLLTLSRMDENPKPCTEEISISSMLQEELNAFQPGMEEKGIVLTCDIEDNIFLRADSQRIQNLLTILIDNAVFYTEAGGHIGVTLSGKKQHFTLQIKNTCPTLPNVPPEKLFERFYRADEARDQSDGKCGIGLSIAKAIVEAQKGSISANYISSNEICFSVKI